jgi:hypothetical protein
MRKLLGLDGGRGQTAAVCRRSYAWAFWKRGAAVHAFRLGWDFRRRRAVQQSQPGRCRADLFGRRLGPAAHRCHGCENGHGGRADQGNEGSHVRFLLERVGDSLDAQGLGPVYAGCDPQREKPLASAGARFTSWRRGPDFSRVRARPRSLRAGSSGGGLREDRCGRCPRRRACRRLKVFADKPPPPQAACKAIDSFSAAR